MDAGLTAGGAEQRGNAPVPQGPRFFSPAGRERGPATWREADRLGPAMGDHPRHVAALGARRSVAGEHEVKHAPTMTILDRSASGRSFTGYGALDFNEDAVLMGHVGPGPLAIAPGKIKVRPRKGDHGEVGPGRLGRKALRHGPVTFRSVLAAEGGKRALLGAEAEPVSGPIMDIGNANSRSQFAGGAREFVNRGNVPGPAEPCAVGVGQMADRLAKSGARRGLAVGRGG